jgi:tetratricopeptide (TPR) repeat protein
MTRSLACLCLLLAALCSARAHAQPAVADRGGAAAAGNPDDEARRHYERGLALYEDAAYDAALGELVRAYELRPAPILLYNIALVNRALNDHAAALQAFRQYAAASGKSLNEARRSEVESQISELEQRVAEVTVQVDVPGAQILIDNRLVGASPLHEPLLVNAGMRQLTVQHPDFAPQNRQLRLAGNDRVEQVFRLGAAHEAQAASKQARSEEPDARRRRVRGLVISWGITGALAAAALGCGISALRHDRALADARESLAPDTDALQADSDKTRRLALATDVLMVSALGAGAVSLWWTLRRPRARPDQQSAALGSHAGTGFRLGLGVGPTSVLVRASY